MRTFLTVVLVLLLTGCGGRAPAPAGGNPAAPAKPPANPAPAKGARYDGQYEGKVNRGYGIKFTVSNSQVTKVSANVLETCSDSTTSKTTTFYLDGPFPISADGKVQVAGKDEVTKGDFRFAATFGPDGSASGTIFQEFVIVGVQCTIYELQWTAQKK